MKNRLYPPPPPILTWGVFFWLGLGLLLPKMAWAEGSYYLNYDNSSGWNTVSWNGTWYSTAGGTISGASADPSGKFYAYNSQGIALLTPPENNPTFPGSALYVGYDPFTGNLLADYGAVAGMKSRFRIQESLATVETLYLGNGALAPSSTANRPTLQLNGNILVAEGANGEFRSVKSEDHLTFRVASAISGGKDAVLNITSAGTDGANAGQVEIMRANNTFSGTWKVHQNGWLYLGTSGTLGQYTNGLGADSSLELVGTGAKAVLFSSQTLQNLAITATGTTFTIANNYTATIEDTWSLCEDYSFCGTEKDTSKTIAARNIRNLSATGITLTAGGGGTQSGNLAFATLGESGKPIHLVQNIGTLRGYAGTVGRLAMTGNYTATAGTLSLDWNLGQFLDVDGNIAVTSLTVTPATTITDSGKVYSILRATGTVTGYDKVTLGTGLENYQKAVVGNTLYAGTAETLGHTYYTLTDSGGPTWHSLSGNTTTSWNDVDGSYFVTYTEVNGTRDTSYVDVSGTFGGKALYVGYNPDGTLCETYGSSFGSTDATMRLTGNLNMGDATLYLGNGALVIGGTGTLSLQGKLVVEKGSEGVIRGNSSSGNQRKMNLEAVVEGEGTIHIACRTGENFRRDSAVSVQRANNPFTGTWSVEYDSNLFATAENALGSGATLILADGNSRAFLTASQTLDTVRVAGVDAVLAAGTLTGTNRPVLSVENLVLSHDFTWKDQTFTYHDNTSETYLAGMLDVATVSSESSVPLTLTVENGTFQAQTIGSRKNSIHLFQSGGLVQVNLDGDPMDVYGDLTLSELFLTAGDDFWVEEGKDYSVATWTGTGIFDSLNLLAADFLADYTWNYRVEGNELFVFTSTSGVPEPATGLLLLLGLCLSRFLGKCSRKVGR